MICHPDLYWILETMVKPGSMLGKLSRAENFPSQLKALVGVEQDKVWHPEGDAWNHTVEVVDAMAKIFHHRVEYADCTRDYQVKMLLAAIAHDVGKAITTEWNEDKQKWTAYGHEVVGVPIARELLLSWEVSEEVIAFVLPLVRWHMSHCRPANQWTTKSVRKLVANLAPATLPDLLLLMEADCRGRGTASSGLPASVDVLVRLTQENQACPPSTT